MSRPTPPEDSLLRPHRLSFRDFDTIASGGPNLPAIRRLKASEHSQRLLLLRALLDSTSGRSDVSGPLPPLDQAWDLLISAERAGASQVATVLDHPTIGLWAAKTLRRLRANHFDDTPLWVEVGHLHAIAAAAGVRARIRFRTTLPVRRGLVALPALGHARLPGLGPWEVADLVADEGPPRITTPWHEVSCSSDAGDPLWKPLPAVTVRHEDLSLRLFIDDADPYRHPGRPEFPVPLRGHELERWSTLARGAWRILASDHPNEAAELAELLRSMVPTAAAPRFLSASASSGNSFGAVILSMPDSDVQLAATLVHEAQHAKLGALLHLLDLYTPEESARFYAPWRDDPRPLGGLLQGIFAFFGVTRFWRQQRTAVTGHRAMAAHFEFALWREGVRRATDTIASRPELTALGHRFLMNLSTVLAGWLAEPVPPTALRWARAVHDDHRSGWRLHHVRPSPAEVEALAEAWATDRRPPEDTLHPAPVLAADPEASDLQVRAVLVRHLLHDQRSPRSWPSDAADLGSQLRGAIRADLSWLDGRTAAAAAGFEHALDRAPDDPHAWSGLALAARDASEHTAALALVERPELVRAVHRLLRTTERTSGPGRLELARWIGQYLRPVPSPTMS